MTAPTREYLYGLNPCFEAIRSGRRNLYEGFISESTRKNPRVRKLTALLDKSRTPWNWVEKGRVHDLSGNRDDQGVALKVSPYPYVNGGDLLTEPRLLLLDNVEDPHNVGAILRSAEIFGFHGVFLPVKGVPGIYPSIVKVSAGASEFLRISKDRNGPAVLRLARDAGYRIVALDGSGTSLLQHTMAAPRTLVVIGGEDKSVGQYILNNSDVVARIPQSGRISSLNAAVAAGIALYALRGNPPEFEPASGIMPKNTKPGGSG